MVIVVSMITIQLNSIPSIRVQADLYSRWYATRQLLESGRNLYDVKNMEEVAGYKTISHQSLRGRFFLSSAPDHIFSTIGGSVLPHGAFHLDIRRASVLSIGFVDYYERGAVAIDIEQADSGFIFGIIFHSIYPAHNLVPV